MPKRPSGAPRFHFRRPARGPGPPDAAAHLSQERPARLELAPPVWRTGILPLDYGRTIRCVLLMLLLVLFHSVALISSTIHATTSPTITSCRSVRQLLAFTPRGTFFAMARVARHVALGKLSLATVPAPTPYPMRHLFGWITMMQFQRLRRATIHAWSMRGKPFIFALHVVLAVPFSLLLSIAERHIIPKYVLPLDYGRIFKDRVQVVWLRPYSPSAVGAG